MGENKIIDLANKIIDKTKEAEQIKSDMVDLSNDTLNAEVQLLTVDYRHVTTIKLIRPEKLAIAKRLNTQLAEAKKSMHELSNDLTKEIIKSRGDNK